MSHSTAKSTLQVWILQRISDVTIIDIEITIFKEIKQN